MTKKLMLATAAAMTLFAAPSAVADPSDPPYPTEPYITIDRYYGTAIGVPPGGLVGWDIWYCDFTVESHREPAANIYAVESEDASCL